MQADNQRTYQDGEAGKGYLPDNPGKDQLSYKQPVENVPDLFDIIANDRRRCILRVLADLGSIELTTLADMVAAIEYETPIDELSYQEKKRVYVGLYQTHVTQLEDAEIVEWADDNTVTQGERFDRVLCKLDAFAQAEPSQEEEEPEPDGLLAVIKGWFR